MPIYTLYCPMCWSPVTLPHTCSASYASWIHYGPYTPYCGTFTQHPKLTPYWVEVTCDGCCRMGRLGASPEHPQEPSL